jgi:hypothetical protein
MSQLLVQSAVAIASLLGPASGAKEADITLQQLTISRCRMSTDTLAKLLTAVARSASLVKLTLAHLDIYPESGTAAGASNGVAASAALWAALLRSTFARPAQASSSALPSSLLQSLNLVGNGLGDAGVQALVRILLKSTVGGTHLQFQSLRKLFLGENNISAVGSASVASLLDSADGALKKTKQGEPPSALGAALGLEELSLAGNNDIDLTGATALASTLAYVITQCASLHIISLGFSLLYFCCMCLYSLLLLLLLPPPLPLPLPLLLLLLVMMIMDDDDAAAADTDACGRLLCSYNTRLLKLDLRQTSIGGAGAMAFAEALATNPFIRTLELDGLDGHSDENLDRDAWEQSTAALHDLVQRNHEWDESPATRLTPHTRMLVEMHSSALMKKIRDLEARLQLLEQGGACESQI